MQETKDGSLIPGLGRSPEGGHGNLLQYSCLGNPMDRGAWQATVHRVTKSWTWLRRLSMHTHRGLVGSNSVSIYTWVVQFSSVAQSCPTLWPHESQHARPPCPSPTPWVHWDSRPSSQRCHPAIASSVVPFSSCPQSFLNPTSHQILPQCQ